MLAYVNCEPDSKGLRQIMEITPQVLGIVIVAALLLWGWALAPKIRKYIGDLIAEERKSNGFHSFHAWRRDRSKMML